MRTFSTVGLFLFAAVIVAGTLPGYSVTFVGSQACEECHSPEYNQYLRHSHGQSKGPLPDETGIGCEACHGPGVNHVYYTIEELSAMAEESLDLQIVVYPDMKTCGGCHGTVEETTIKLASDHLIQHMQSYNELVHAGGMSSNTCITCHNPHISSKLPKGINVSCAHCHPQVSVNIPQMAEQVACLDCHMPFAVSAGTGTMVNEYQKGEYRSHLFGISVDPAYRLNDGSGNAALDGDGSAQLTVDMTCAACHQTDEAPAFSREQLLENAPKVHN